MSPFSLKDKVICITGASSGIGRQCAVSCSQMGATVVLMARNEERLCETLSAMENPDKHMMVPVDLTEYAQVGLAVKDIVNKAGKINGVLHCAGISTTLPLKLVTPDKLQDFFKVNVFSAYNLTKEVCKMGHFSKEGGSIVFFSSVMGKVGESGKSLYGMTKGALVSARASRRARRWMPMSPPSPGICPAMRARSSWQPAPLPWALPLSCPPTPPSANPTPPGCRAPSPIPRAR